MLDEKQELAVHLMQPDVVTARKQRHQMLIALSLLLLALILVLLKDWHFWFPTPVAVAPKESLEKSIQPVPAAEEAKATFVRSERVPTKNKEADAAPPMPSEAPGIVASNRAVLPPLQVEVVAGNRRHTIQPASNSVRVDLQADADAPLPSGSAVASNNPPAPLTGEVVNATESMHISPNAAQIISRPVEPNYPLLAKQMKVQGSVILQALIDRGGNIEDLHVLSGPAILSSAAMQAVKQWRFRPYYMAGEAVETQARITVNFTISTY
jgi:protein TonB